MINFLAFILSAVPLVFGADDALYIAAAAAIIGGLTTAGVGIANSISAKKNRKAAERTIGGLNAENSSNYYSDYYRSALDNDSTRAYLKRLDAAMRRQNRSLDNTIVSSGATHENALAARQGRNEVMGGAMAQAVAAEDARRDRVRNNYFARKSQLEQAEMNSRQWYSQQKQQNRATIASGVGQIASSIANLYGAGAFGSGAGAATQAAAQNQIGGQIAADKTAAVQGITARNQAGIDKWNANWNRQNMPKGPSPALNPPGYK